MVEARSCALTAVASFLAVWLGRKENTVRQQWREFCYGASDKRGRRRQEIRVESCFVPLLRWVVAGSTGQQVALALEATHLGDRFSVLAVSVVYRGCALPVAWTILKATEKHAWRGEWLRLLRQVRPALPRPGTVIVLADRGLSARWLLRRIVRLGWHPFWRINRGGTFRPAGQKKLQPLAHFVRQPGTRWRGCGTAFRTKECRLHCTLLASWEDGCAEPWLILTDWPPDVSDAGWYGLRAWIEQSFKMLKRGGWPWQRTRMTDPERAARLWLAVSVATLWLRRVGGAAEATLPESPLPALGALEHGPVLTAPRRSRRATRRRLVSVFRRGWLLIHVALLRHDPLPFGAFLPEPWPAVPCLSTPTVSAGADHAQAA